MNNRLNRFLAELKGWSIYGTINAIPPFLIALDNEWNRPESIAGMVFAVICFIGFLSLFTSSGIFQRIIRKGNLEWGFRAAKILRSAYALVGLPLLFMEFAFIYIIEIYAGILSAEFMQILFENDIIEPRISDGGTLVPIIGDMYSFIPTVLMTFSTGLLLFTVIVVLGLLLSLLRFSGSKAFGYFQKA